MSSSSWSLSSLEISITRTRASLSWAEHIRIHSETHRASRLSPVESSVDEDRVESFGFGLGFDETGSWYNHRVDSREDLTTSDDLGGGS